MRTYKLHLIRHGLTQGNLDRVYMGGGLDMPLCQEGRKGLEIMRESFSYPNVGVVFSSPMKRAIESAEILYPYMKDKIVLEELRENNFGEFEGRKIDDLAHDENFSKWLDPASDYIPKGGEGGREFAGRTARALFTMLEYMAVNNISEAACISHGGVMMSMLSQHAVPRKSYNEWLSDNGAGFTVISNTAMIMRDRLVEAVGILPEGYL